jgi:D-galactarolactone isomerase
MTARLRFTVPEGACDTHVHIFEPGRLDKPPAVAPVADYRALYDSLGITRAVFVQPPAFGFDNAATLEAAATMGRNARSVVVVRSDTPDTELARLNGLGARGVRFHMLRKGLTWEEMPGMAERLAPLGWHIQIQLAGLDLPERAPLLSRLAVPIVIDHIAKFAEPIGLDHPAFRTLAGLVEGGNTYVKLSAVYESGNDGPPAYQPSSALVRELVRIAPARLLWGSNWPHYSTPLDQRSDDAGLLDLLADWADENQRRQILVDNPARLYGFAA